MSSAKSGFNTMFYKNGVVIAEVTSIGGVDTSVSFADVTSMNSTNSWEEFIPTVKSGGSLSFEVNYIPSNNTHKDLFASLAAMNSASYAIVLPTAASNCNTSFTGYVEKLSPKPDMKGKIGLSGSIKVTGEVLQTVPA